jgi:hypothetical protein
MNGKLLLVADGAALGAITTGLDAGSIAYVASRTTYWSYQPLSPGPADGNHIASAAGGYWVYFTAAAPSDAMAKSAWFVDPVHGSDDNSGATTEAAVQHLAEIVRRWGTLTPLLPNATTVTPMSSLPATDECSIQPVLVGAGSLTIAPSLDTPVATTTVSAFAAINRTAGTKPTVSAAAGSPSDFWTPYVGMLVVDPTSGSCFFVESDAGDATAVITTPLVYPIVGVPDLGSVAVGDTLQVFDLPTVYVTQAAFRGYGSSFVPYQLSYLTINSDGVATLAGVTCNACFMASILVASSASNFEGGSGYNGCHFGTSTFQGTGSFFGGTLGTSAPRFGDRTSLDGDVYLNRDWHAYGELALGNVYMAAWAANSTASAPLTVVLGGFVNYETAILWGPVAVAPARGLRVQINDGFTATSTLVNTGGLSIDGATTGLAFPFSGEPVTITPASIDDSGGGLWGPSGAGFFTGLAA